MNDCYLTECIQKLKQNVLKETSEVPLLYPDILDSAQTAVLNDSFPEETISNAEGDVLSVGEMTTVVPDSDAHYESDDDASLVDCMEAEVKKQHQLVIESLKGLNAVKPADEKMEDDSAVAQAVPRELEDLQLLLEKQSKLQEMSYEYFIEKSRKIERELSECRATRATMDMVIFAIAAGMVLVLGVLFGAFQLPTH